ncbi:hypothetical protein [Maribacter sp. R77961]|uniref:hypothetical protein n=1 Tax=Maribacter sp. R77961 TaxID=3093871 RepID=UPI0037C7EB03
MIKPPRTFLKYAITIVILLSFCTVDAQETVDDSLEILTNIDPRQYITVKEVRNLKKKNIWKYKVNDNLNSNQENVIIDTKSLIEIYFEKQKIFENINFKGEITIEGKIVSSDGGEDPVEVFPYTKIGEEKSTIGVPLRPLEIATIFANLIKECYTIQIQSDLQQAYGNSYVFLYTEIDFLLSSNSVINNVQNFQYQQDNGLETTSNRLKLIYDEIIDNEHPIALQVLQELDEGNIVNIDNLISELEEIRSYALLNKISILKDYLNRFKIIANYIKYFKQSGVKAEDAFLKGIEQDYIWLDAIESRLLEDIESFETSLEEDMLNDAISLKRSIELQIDKLTRNIPESNILKKLENIACYEILKRDDCAVVITKSEIIKEITQDASKNIYLELDYGTINLRKERAKEGDVLYLYVILEKNRDRRKEAGVETEKKVLPIGTYELRQTGWQVKISDSFLLVNRIDEPTSEESSSLSPSNFKGAPGVSLMLTYRRDGKKDSNRLVNFLEPSIGANVSYVDFSTEDDIEVGAGLVLGFFNNKIFLTGGINLNMTGNGETSPYYWGVGFSFANIASKILGNK